MTWEEIRIIKSSEVDGLLEKRGIRDDDVRQVIHIGEATGLKLYQADKYLAKKRLGEFTLYVEYRPVADGYEVLTAYSHRVQLKSDMR